MGHVYLPLLIAILYWNCYQVCCIKEKFDVINITYYYNLNFE